MYCSETIICPVVGTLGCATTMGSEYGLTDLIVTTLSKSLPPMDDTIPTPIVNDFQLVSGDTLVLATDGVWDVLNSKHADILHWSTLLLRMLQLRLPRLQGNDGLVIFQS